MAKQKILAIRDVDAQGFHCHLANGEVVIVPHTLGGAAPTAGQYHDDGIREPEPEMETADQAAPALPEEQE
jgi:hypothetical protein